MPIPVTVVSNSIEPTDSGDAERCATIDLVKEDDLASIGLGAYVKVVLLAEVVGLRGVEQNKYDGKVSEWPGQLKLEVESFKIEKVSDFDPGEDDEEEG